MKIDLFDDQAATHPWTELLEPGAIVLRGFAIAEQTVLLADLRHVLDQAPLRHLLTPGGHRMSVAMSNCGALGWVSDRTGYRYDAIDPLSDNPWPRMPESFSTLATRAAATAGFEDFEPDACLINRYESGARLSLHQDRNERDFTQPIVSVSLGILAVFLFGGDRRSDPQKRVSLNHGDVVVWGGAARLRYHGVLPLKDGQHALLGGQRFNLTFRKAR